MLLLHALSESIIWCSTEGILWVQA
ncbi:hypothetical protein Taro_034408, partial [Colocasia esculenta]|nr:hypothetical protein [Colocasia esculenta]